MVEFVRTRVIRRIPLIGRRRRLLSLQMAYKFELFELKGWISAISEEVLFFFLNSFSGFHLHHILAVNGRLIEGSNESLKLDYCPGILTLLTRVIPESVPHRRKFKLRQFSTWLFLRTISSTLMDILLRSRDPKSSHRLASDCLPRLLYSLSMF